MHWDGLSVEEATWEDEVQFKDMFPSYNLEDKVGVDPGGNDTHVNKRLTDKSVEIGSKAMNEVVLAPNRPKRER